MLCKICSNTSKHSSINSTFSTIIRYVIILFTLLQKFYKTHYEVLKLNPDCSYKDIKNAFIKLSKKHHPDVNKSTQSHNKFLAINEAYRVLGKSESRRNYDLGLFHYNPEIRRHSTEAYHEDFFKNPYHDPLFWTSRDKSRDEFYKNTPYYGIRGVPRLPNGIIVAACIIFALIGVGVQYLAITRSFTFQRDELIKKSQEAENVWKNTRQTAHHNGNNAQLEALKMKLLGRD